MKLLTIGLCVVFLAFGISQPIRAQDSVARARALTTERSDREQDGLNGPVRRLRVETAKLLVKGGKAVESSPALRELTTYDPKGKKLDSVAYPVEGSTVPGKEEYQYDDKGNIVEMTLRAGDGSVLSKEKYEYEFDEFGNWKKMTSAVAVYENGRLGYEPTEVTYRTITYYYAQSVAKLTGASVIGPTPGAANTTNDKNLSKPATLQPPPKSNEVKNTPAPKDEIRVSTSVETSPSKSATKDETRVSTPVETSPSKTATKDETRVSTPVETSPSKTEKVETPAVALGDATPKEDRKLPAIHVGEETLRKAALELPEPEYPKAATMARVQGRVEIQLGIDEKGMVVNAHPVSGSPLLFEAAENAARKARFSPRVLSSEPATAFGVITYEFALPPEPKSSAAETSSSSVSQPTTVAERVATEKPLAEKPPAASSKPLASASSFEKGMASLGSAKYSEAVEFFKQAIVLDPKDAISYSKLGIAYSGLKEHKEAIMAFKQAIRLERAFVDVEAYYRMGDAYISLGEHEAAIEPLKRALYGIRAQQLDPQSHKPGPGSPTLLQIHYDLGLAYYGTGSLRKASNEFEEAVHIDQDSAQAHYGLGLSYFGIGDKGSAAKEEQILRKLKSPLADKLMSLLLVPASQRNKIF
ncbi:MAG TPA: TonB family protein [Candidatus Bathyarchaeia archaeon]|nr:TonB family protein [Candidatus Bathyarchaeia archaeon]